MIGYMSLEEQVDKDFRLARPIHHPRTGAEGAVRT